MSPSRRRPRPLSPPPRRPLYERIQRSHSPRPRSSPRPRNRSPRNRRPQDRRLRTRTSTPVSSSRGHTPSPKYGKSERSPRTVKVEPSIEAVPNVPSNTANPALGDTSASGVGDQPPVLPRASADRNRHQGPPSLNLTLGEHATVASTSPQPSSAQADPFSPVFAPETPLIPGLSASVPLTRPQMTAISALQKSLEQVIKDQVVNPAIQPSGTLPPSTSTSHPEIIPEREKTEIWTTRIKCAEFDDFAKGATRFADTFFD